MCDPREAEGVNEYNLKYIARDVKPTAEAIAYNGGYKRLNDCLMYNSGRDYI